MHDQMGDGELNGASGDWGFDFSFCLATYSIGTWWHLFFPEDMRYRDAMAQSIRDIIADYEKNKKDKT